MDMYEDVYEYKRSITVMIITNNCIAMNCGHSEPFRGSIIALCCYQLMAALL